MTNRDAVNERKGVHYGELDIWVKLDWKKKQAKEIYGENITILEGIFMIRQCVTEKGVTEKKTKNIFHFFYHLEVCK